MDKTREVGPPNNSLDSKHERGEFELDQYDKISDYYKNLRPEVSKTDRDNEIKLRLIECNNAYDFDALSQEEKLRDFTGQLRHLNSQGRVSQVAYEPDQPNLFVESSVNPINFKIPLGYDYNKNGEIFNKYNVQNVEFDSLKVNFNQSSLIDKVISDNPESAKVLCSDILDDSHNREMSEGEIPKTKEQIEQIEKIIDVVNQDRLKHGQEILLIDSRMFRIYDKDYWIARHHDHGHYSQARQSIELIEPRSKVNLLDNVVHELMHADSYNEVVEKYGKIIPKQLGIATIQKKKRYSNVINEALDQERARRIIKLFLDNDPYYADEVAETERIKQEYPNIKEYNIFRNRRKGRGKKIFADDGALAAKLDGADIIFSGGGYRFERNAFDKFLNKISRHSGKSKDQIYDNFLDANKDGNISKIENLVDGLFGKGVFKTVDESGVNYNKFKGAVNKLEFIKKINGVKNFAKSIINRLFGIDVTFG